MEVPCGNADVTLPEKITDITLIELLLLEQLIEQRCNFNVGFFCNYTQSAQAILICTKRII